jgi:hypothetical protein
MNECLTEVDPCLASMQALLKEIVECDSLQGNATAYKETHSGLAKPNKPGRFSFRPLFVNSGSAMAMAMAIAKRSNLIIDTKSTYLFFEREHSLCVS